jgi:hypothetical protein
MATWDTVDHYFSGQGVVLLAERDPTTGLPMGFVPVGNVSALALSISTSVNEHKESHTGQRGTDLRLTNETKCALSMTMENFISANLALVSRGTETTVVGGSVVDQLIPAYLGMVIGTGKIKLSAVTVKTATDTLLVSGTDYEVNLDNGSIKLAAVITGVTNGADVKVSYTFATQKRVEGLTVGGKDLFMRFEGLNTAESNSPVLVEVFKMSTDPFKELALIGDDVQQFTLEGSVLSDSSRATGSKYFAVSQLN